MDSKVILGTGLPQEEKCLKDLKKRLTKHSKELEGLSWLIDDSFLHHFVRGKKYNAEKAEKALKQYFHVRRDQYKQLFLEMTHPETDMALRKEAVSVLKGKDDNGRGILIIKFSLWSNEMSLDDLTTAMVLVVEECWNCPKVETEGLQIVVDLAGFCWDHFKILTPFAVYKAVNIFWSSMPLRYKNVHLVNSGNLFEILLKTIKSFLPTTLRQRLIVHPPHYEDLHKSISTQVLPTCLGGKVAEEEAYDTELIQRIYGKGEHYRRIAECL